MSAAPDLALGFELIHRQSPQRPISGPTAAGDRQQPVPRTRPVRHQATSLALMHSPAASTTTGEQAPVGISTTSNHS